MEYKLTSTFQRNRRNKAGVGNSFLLFFLNGTFIFKQKVPYDEHMEPGSGHRTSFTAIYILNGNLFQTRQATVKGKIREVRYPLSVRQLEEFNIPKDLRIDLSDK